MNQAYISPTIFRRYLGLLAASGLKLPETVNIITNGTGREFTVLHRIDLAGMPQQGEASGADEPTMKIASWAVAPPDNTPKDEKQEWVLIDPELDWVKNVHFWVGKTERVYGDVNISNDKKLSGFGWCGNTERELKFPTFNMLTNGPLFTIDVRLSMLDLLAVPTTVNVTEASKAGGKSNNVVGTIEVDGTFRPVGHVGVIEPATMNTIHKTSAEKVDKLLQKESSTGGNFLNSLADRIFGPKKQFTSAA